jgi:gamma-glutamyl phosphate reductase
VPVIKHYKGVCHLFVDASADLGKAIDLLVDGKCSRPAACNSLETLLVHRDVAEAFLPRVAQALGERGVQLRADAQRSRCCRAARRPPKRTTPPSSSIWCWRCAWSMISRRPSRTSAPIPPTTPK